jgi:anti-sigma factor RsiW
MRCSSCEPLLDAYLEASLRSRETAQVAAHLQSCAGCTWLLAELRVVDALLATARPPHVPADITPAVVSVTRATPPRTPRRLPLGLVLALYLAVAWSIVVAALRSNDLGQIGSSFSILWQRDLAALVAVAHALAPATPVAAAVVTGVLLLDLLLLCALFYGYHRVAPMLALYLRREPRS